MEAAKRLEDIAPFRVMELLARANELADCGHDVIHLEVGEPDFPTPSPIIAAAQQALSEGATRYTDARGNIQLRQAISTYYLKRFSVDISPARIFVTAGASGALLLMTALLTNPGDNVLMTDPGYPCNRHFLTSFGAEGRLVPVSASDNYQLTPDLIDHYWDEKSCGALVASPANPTGSILSLEEAAALSRKLRELDGFFLVDEIYQGLVYEGRQTNTVLALDTDAFIINSFSKYFGMTGWRLGWMIVPDRFTRGLEKLAQNLFICPSAIAQSAALAAFSDEALGIMEGQRQEFEERRNFLVPELQALGFDIPSMPAGAFYIYAGLPAGISHAESFCSDLLEKEFVALTPGTDFGFHESGARIRISYARDRSQLEDAVKRIGRYLDTVRVA